MPTKRLILLMATGALLFSVFFMTKGVALAATSPDLNRDGIVNVQDLGILLANWCDPSCTTAKITAADLNGDSKVQVQDLGMLLSKWGMTVVTPTPTPTITQPPTSGTGIPFGPADLLGEDGNTTYFRFSIDGTTANRIDDLAAEARSKKVKVLLNMAGGHHINYMSDLNGGTCELAEYDRNDCAFDFDLWKNRMDEYNTSAIKDLVAKAVADGVIIGNNVMDEPWVSGGDDGAGVIQGNTWGPPGTMTKTKVDQLCAYAKNMFPTLPVGVSNNHQIFEKDKSYNVCDFVIEQYSYRFGDVATYRSNALSYARRDGYQVLFSLNWINGGTQDRDGTWDCADQGGVKGSRSPNCQMTPTQYKNAAIALGTYTSGGQMIWRHEFDTASRNYSATQEVYNALSQVPYKPLRRR